MEIIRILLTISLLIMLPTLKPKQFLKEMDQLPLEVIKTHLELLPKAINPPLHTPILITPSTILLIIGQLLK